MNLEALNLFVDAMRFGNFTEVARAHDMAPSSVSRAIAGLEKELGVRLFQRTTRKLTPTEAAAAFFHRVNPALAEIDAARARSDPSTRGHAANHRAGRFCQRLHRAAIAGTG